MTTEAEVLAALRTRYVPREWALVTQVRDGAGWDRRTMDALAIGLWASRGHPIHGFEVKVSRGDWRRELAQPEKAEPLVAFCDRWYVVTPRGIIDPLSLPEGWGLLEAMPGGTIRTVREADRRVATPPTMGFVAQIAKRLLAEHPSVQAIEAARRQGMIEGEAVGATTANIAKGALADLKERVRVFEEGTGLSVAPGYGSDQMRRYAELVRKIMAEEGWDGATAHLRQARRHAQLFLERVDALFPEEAT